jgi:hypothetical protein
MIQRRAFLGGLVAAFAAPAIVKAGSLMPVRAIAVDWLPCDGRFVSRALYPELFAVLGSEYGNDGSGRKFRLPDMRASGGHVEAGLMRPTHVIEYQIATVTRPDGVWVGNLLPFMMEA